MRRFIFALFAAVLAISAPASAAVTSISPKPTRVLCKVIATSSLTLSGAQTIDSVSCVAGDLVCPVAQSDNKNGPYIVQAGAWKAADPGVQTGLELYATRGGSNINKVYGADTGSAIVWGTTAVTFTLKAAGGVVPTPFDPASPGAIGGTTPAAGSFTTLAGTIVSGSTSVSGPIHIVTATSGAGSPTASTTKFWRSNSLPGDNLILQGGTGDTFVLRFESGSNSSDVRKRFFSKSIADDATFDITVAGGGHGIITAAGASGSSSCAFSFAVSGATTDNGLTGTNCAVADTDTKLCAIAGAAGHTIIKNRLGSTQTVLIELTETVAN